MGEPHRSLRHFFSSCWSQKEWIVCTNSKILPVVNWLVWQTLQWNVSDKHFFCVTLSLETGSYVFSYLRAMIFSKIWEFTFYWSIADFSQNLLKAWDEYLQSHTIKYNVILNGVHLNNLSVYILKQMPVYQVSPEKSTGLWVNVPSPHLFHLFTHILSFSTNEN